MGKVSIADLAALKENEQIELKRCGEKIPLSFYETYSAMANGSGGDIYLGITEGEEENVISGVENAPQKKKQLANALSNKTKIANVSFQDSDIEIIDADNGKKIIRVHVEPVPMDARPVYLDGDPGKAYKRVAEGDKKLDENEISALINDASKTKYDQRPNSLDFDEQDLDEAAVTLFIDLVKAASKIPFAGSLSSKELLTRIGAYVYDKTTRELKLTNAAVLFLGKSYAVNSLCPSLWMDYQEKRDTGLRFDTRITIKDISNETNIFHFYYRVLSRLKEVLPSPFYLEGETNVGWRVLFEAVREALANAISNVELFTGQGLTIIKIPNGISFTNAGGLLTGLEQARRGGVSAPRNPGLFSFFLAMGISDHGGYGIPNIFESMRKLNMSEPELSESASRDLTRLSLSFIRVSRQFSPLQKRAIAFLSSSEGMSSKEIADHLGISMETARTLLLSLMEKGIVSDNGKPRKGKLYFLSSSLD